MRKSWFSKLLFGATIMLAFGWLCQAQARHLKHGLRPADIGAANGDYVISLPSGSYTGAKGYISAITNATSVAGYCDIRGACYPCVQGTACSANEYNVQLNTNVFASGKCPSTSPQCLGWEQFVYDSGGGINVQLWLLNYVTSQTPKCPANFAPNPPNSFNCLYKPSPVNGLPIVQFDNIAGITLVATATRNGQDTLTVTIPGQKAITPITFNDNIIGLAGKWTKVEFNVYGEGNLTQAFFNPNAQVSAAIAVTRAANSGSPSCSTSNTNVNGSTTGETANLYYTTPCIAKSSTSYLYSEASPPVVQSISPLGGSAGDKVTVSGQGFTPFMSVLFGGANATVIGCNGNGITGACTVSVPAGSGTVHVTVANYLPNLEKGPYSVPDNPATSDPFHSIADNYTYEPVGSFTTNCPPGENAVPPNYTYTTPTPSDFYTWTGTPLNKTTPPPANMDFLSTGTMSSGPTNDEPIFIAACLPGTRNACTSKSLDTAGAWCYTHSPPPPPPPPARNCEICVDTGRQCVKVAGGYRCKGNIQ